MCTPHRPGAEGGSPRGDTVPPSGLVTPQPELSGSCHRRRSPAPHPHPAPCSVSSSPVPLERLALPEPAALTPGPASPVEAKAQPGQLELMELEDPDEERPAGGCFYGWAIVLCVILVKITKLCGTNVLITYAVPGLLHDFELSRGVLSLFFSAGTISAAMLQPLVGAEVDRRGVRLCLGSALCLFSGALVLFCVTPDAAPPLLALDFFFIRGFALGVLEVTGNAAVNKWFSRHRGRANAAVALAAGLTAAAVGIAVSAATDAHGWRSVWGFFAIANLAAAAPCFLVVRDTPESIGLLPDGAQRVKTPAGPLPENPVASATGGGDEAVVQAKRDPLVRLLFLCSLLSGMIGGGADFHMVTLWEEAGLTVDIAHAVFLPLFLTQTFVLPFAGRLADAITTRGVAVGIGLSCIVGGLTAVPMCFGSVAAAVTYAVVRGLQMAYAQTTLFSGFVFAALYGRDSVGRLLGINILAVTAGTGVGPLVYGVTHDILHTFVPQLMLTGIALALAGTGVIVLALRRPQGGRGRATASGGYEKVPAVQEEPGAHGAAHPIPLCPSPRSCISYESSLDHCRASFDLTAA
eukprot:TRINITY_DN50039_c0_g1_i1.p1 TRINITY_DN50039_c0_g1~~TRINITY_DN50039_c0_g1_i1.p1  ORF type:complete len:605 (+),score=134.61 TRINITY_DN50039_c0_g1_i1:79-1815(+)